MCFFLLSVACSSGSFDMNLTALDTQVLASGKRFLVMLASVTFAYEVEAPV